MEKEFPGNANRAKQAQKRAEKKIKKVVTTPATVRKKPLGARLRDIFGGGDSRSVLEYVIDDVLLPAAKDMIVDAGTAALERKFFGEDRPRGRSRTASSANPLGHVAYGSFTRSAQSRAETRPSAMTRRPGGNRELLVDSRAVASAVLDEMNRVIEEFDIVTIADMNDMVEFTGDYTDEHFGWTSMQGFSIRRDRGGKYAIVTPRPEAID